MKWKNEINKLKQCWTISYISFQSSFKFKFIPVRNRYTKKKILIWNEQTKWTKTVKFHLVKFIQIIYHASLFNYFILTVQSTRPHNLLFYWTIRRSRSRRIAKFLRESVLIAFDFIWRVLLSDKNFATLLDPPLIRKIWPWKLIKV